MPQEPCYNRMVYPVYRCTVLRRAGGWLARSAPRSTRCAGYYPGRWEVVTIHEAGTRWTANWWRCCHRYAQGLRS